MKPTLFFALICASLLATSCGKNSKVEYQRWNGEGEKPSLEGRQMREISSLTLGSQKVEILEQQAAEFPIAGTFAKRVSRNKEPNFMSVGIVKNISEKDIEKARDLADRKDAVWKKFLQKNSRFKSYPVIEPPQVKISSEDKIQPLIFAVVQRPTGELEEIQLQNSGKILSAKRVGSEFGSLRESPAFVFPKGPKLSELSKVSIRRFAQPQDLSSEGLEVQTASPLKILNDQNLDWGVQDERFGQVQAFFQASRFLNWLKEKTAISQLAKIGIVTDVGYPEKTNAAFYYNGLVRLGAGDDVVFSRISWDPSIVAHEISHGVIDQISRLPFEGEGGSVNEGFADTLTTFFLESPLLGENSYKMAPFKRTVEARVHWNNRNGGLYHDSALVSGLFWEMRSKLGSAKTMKLVMDVLSRLSPRTDFQDFRTTLNEQVPVVFSGEELDKALDLLKERDLLDE